MRDLPHRCPCCESRALVLFSSVECSNRYCKHFKPSKATSMPQAKCEDDSGVTYTVARYPFSTTTPMCCADFMLPFYVTGQNFQWHCSHCGRVQ